MLSIRSPQACREAVCHCVCPVHLSVILCCTVCCCAVLNCLLPCCAVLCCAVLCCAELCSAWQQRQGSSCLHATLQVQSDQAIRPTSMLWLPVSCRLTSSRVSIPLFLLLTRSLIICLADLVRVGQCYDSHCRPD